MIDSAGSLKYYETIGYYSVFGSERPLYSQKVTKPYEHLNEQHKSVHRTLHFMYEKIELDLKYEARELESHPRKKVFGINKLVLERKLMAEQNLDEKLVSTEQNQSGSMDTSSGTQGPSLPSGSKLERVRNIIRKTPFYHRLTRNRKLNKIKERTDSMMFSNEPIVGNYIDFQSDKPINVLAKEYVQKNRDLLKERGLERSKWREQKLTFKLGSPQKAGRNAWSHENSLADSTPSPSVKTKTLGSSKRWGLKRSFSLASAHNELRKKIPDHELDFDGFYNRHLSYLRERNKQAHLKAIFSPLGSRSGTPSVSRRAKLEPFKAKIKKQTVKSILSELDHKYDYNRIQESSQSPSPRPRGSTLRFSLKRNSGVSRISQQKEAPITKAERSNGFEDNSDNLGGVPNLEPLNDPLRDTRNSSNSGFRQNDTKLRLDSVRTIIERDSENSSLPTRVDTSRMKETFRSLAADSLGAQLPSQETPMPSTARLQVLEKNENQMIFEEEEPEKSKQREDEIEPDEGDRLTKVYFKALVKKFKIRVFKTPSFGSLDNALKVSEDHSEFVQAERNANKAELKEMEGLKKKIKARKDKKAKAMTFERMLKERNQKVNSSKNESEASSDWRKNYLIYVEKRKNQKPKNKGIKRQTSLMNREGGPGSGVLSGAGSPPVKMYSERDFGSGDTSKIRIIGEAVKEEEARGGDLEEDLGQSPRALPNLELRNRESSYTETRYKGAFRLTTGQLGDGGGEDAGSL